MRILLDVDGVLADFAGDVVRIANEVCCRKGLDARRFRIEDVNCFDIAEALQLTAREWHLAKAMIGAPGFAQSLNVYPGAYEGVAELIAAHDVHYVTAPWPSDTWCRDRQRWLAAEFMAHFDEVTFTHRKELVAGDVLIEDKPETLEAWCKAHPQGHGILWSRPWNASYDIHLANGAIVRVSTWDEVMLAVESQEMRLRGLAAERERDLHAIAEAQVRHKRDLQDIVDAPSDKTAVRIARHKLKGLGH